MSVVVTVDDGLSPWIAIPFTVFCAVFVVYVFVMMYKDRH